MALAPRVVKTEVIVPRVKEVTSQPPDSDQKPRIIKTEEVKPGEGTAEKRT